MPASLFTSLAAAILRARRPLVVVIVLLTALAAWQLPRLKLDTSNEIWFVEGHPALEALHKFERLFRNDDFVYVVLGTDDFFRPDPVAGMERLAADLEANVPYVLDVTWIGNAEYVEGREDSIDIYELLEDVPRTARALESVKAKAVAEAVYRDTLISTDGATAGLLIELEEYPSDHMDPRKEIAPAVRAVLARPEYEGLELHAVGIPLFDYDFDVITATETARFMGVCLLVQAAILLWVGRGLLAVITPITICVLAVVWTFAWIVFYGFTLNIFVVMLPVLLICVGIGDSMHLIAELHDQRDHGCAPRSSIVRAMGVVGLPCLLTSLTTAAGFLAFTTARIRPFREMGIYAATGVLLALVLTYLLVPILYGSAVGREADDGTEPGEAPGNAPDDARGGAMVAQRAAGAATKPGEATGPAQLPRPVPHSGRNDPFDRLLAGIARIVIGRPRAVIAVFAGLTVAAAFGMTRVEVESATVQMLSTDVPIRRAYDFIDERMGSSMSVEILLDTGTENGINDPVFLQRMDELDAFIRAHPLTATTSSVLDIHRQMRRAFHENRPEYYTIPTTGDEASQYLLLYEMSGGDNRDKLTTYNYDVARLTARTRALDTGDTRRFMADVERHARETFAATVDVEFVGMLPMLDALTELISEGQTRSFAAAAAVIAVIMMLVLRSFRLGLISMIPNIFPVIATLGFMGYAGIYLGVGLMTLSAIIIGVAVDDTIHFFVRFRSEFSRLGSYAAAIESTLATVGRPITFTTVTLTLGFAVLAFSDVTQIVKFGTLAGFAFTWALIAD
ncbi:MAG: MMPL family transporter, partial [Candidatus Binatia bacterium]